MWAEMRKEGVLEVARLDALILLTFLSSTWSWKEDLCGK
jgi:hypothetical protein